VRLYQKGRQAYAKETQLLKAAKHAARAAAKAQAAADLQQQQVLPSHSITSSSSSLAIQPRHNTARAVAMPPAAAARSFPGSFMGGNALAKSFTASFSRLQSPMIVVADQTAAAAGESPRRQASAATGLGLSATSSRAGWLGSGRRSVGHLQQPLLLSGTPSDQGAAAAGSGGLLDGVAAWLPGMLQSDEPSRLADLREVSALCQVRVQS
jgi:hypothetical protein